MNLASLTKQAAYARLGYAAAAFFTPRLATVAIGGRPSQVTPVAMGWAGVFASREAALGALSLGSEGVDAATRRKVLLLNAAVDAVDVAAIVALAKRQRSILPLLVALPVGVLSVVAHVQAAQQLACAPSPSGGTSPENVYTTA